MAGNVTFGRLFAELSNRHRFFIVQTHSLAETSETKCSLFGQRSRRGQSPVEHRGTFVCHSVRPSVRPPPGPLRPEICPFRPEIYPLRPEIYPKSEHIVSLVSAKLWV